MTNKSIYDAFQRMWSHILLKLNSKADFDHSHDDRYYTESEINSKLSSKADTNHTHDIGNITNLQPTLDTKADSDHIHDDRYYTESEVDSKLGEKADSGHTHNYAGSSSAGGAANSAVKLATARNINGVAFDGTKDITVSDRKYCLVGSDTASSNGWYKVASGTMSEYGDTNITFMVTSTFAAYNSGLFQLQFRSENTGIVCKIAQWLTRIGFPSDCIRVVISGMTWTMYVKQTNSQYGRIMFEVISESSISGAYPNLTLYNSGTKESTEPVATVTSSDGATVNYANSAGTATKVGTTTVGSATQPVYINGGTPTATTYTLGKSVPSDAKFTDTVYTHPTYTARTGKPTGNQTPAFGGTATVSQITSDSTGHVTGATDRTITIPSTLSNGTGTAGLIKTTSTVTSNSGYTACPVISGVPYYKDTNTTYGVATSSALGLVKSGTDITVDANGNVSVNDSSHNHNASNINAGTLSSDRLPTVPVAKGGTGATTVAGAKTNLGFLTAADFTVANGVLTLNFL